AVGIAGGPDKVAHLRGLGFDVALDHRTGSLRQELKEAVPQGIDGYYENVGGEVSDAGLPRLNALGLVPARGLGADCHLPGLPEGPDRSGALMGHILTKSLLVRGFIQTEFAGRLTDQFLTDMSGWLKEGKVRYREDIRPGLERAPEYFNDLLTGGNFGKMVVAVGAEG